MLGWLLLPMLLATVFGMAAPRLAPRLPPACATWGLSAGAVTAAGAASAGLAVLAFLALAEAPPARARGGWATSVLRASDPYAVPVGTVAGLVIAVVATRLLLTAARRLGGVRDAARLAAALPDTGAELAVVPSTALQAFAVPGRPGRIVMTSALLQHLDASGRRAVLTHERSHLAHRHHLHQLAVGLATAVLPTLARIPAALELACERWADEDAAAATSRSTVADAVERVATAPARAARPTPVLFAGAADVVTRTAALRDPAGPPARWRVAVLAALVLVTAAATALALHHTEQLFELAQQAYRHGRR
ncbi:MAG: M56 family metallopeptidase [Jatrophihabitans sp.]|uniref:M56 family metallopeptidase n=1 Tax=Jatrophihabitans sp. TaxID=1932789 RepID=UPI003F7F720F